MAGRGDSSESIERIKMYNHVEYLGEVDCLADFYGQVDLIVTNVIKKWLLNKILEAWPYGKCVIGYEHIFYAFESAEKGMHYL